MTSFVYSKLVGITILESRNPSRAEAHRLSVRLYTPDPQALARLAIGTCVTIASLLAVPDAVALLPNSASPIAWLLSVIGIWLSAAILWFVAFLGILHVVSFVVRGVEVSATGVRLWRHARLIPIKKIDALAVESQNFFSQAFSIKPVAKRLTVFECKKSWRRPGVMNLVPHFLPSFYFSPEVFADLCADIAATKFGIAPDAIDGMFAETETFSKLKSLYKTMWWQRVLVTVLIALGLVMFLGRKAIVNYEYNDGNKAMHAGDFKRARELYDYAVMVDPTFAHGWNNLANAEFELGQFSESKKHWEKALLFKPDFVEAKVSLAYIYLQQRDFKAAKDLIDGALMIAPDNSQALVNKADLEFRTGHMVEAARDAQKVLSSNGVSDHAPKFTAACIYAQTLLSQGKYEEAQTVLGKWAPIADPKTNTGENITLALIATSQANRLEGKLDQARKSIQWAEKRAPSNVDVLLEEAKVDLVAADCAAAKTALDKCERFCPGDPWVYILRARLMLMNSKAPLAKTDSQTNAEPKALFATVEKTLDKAFACKHQDRMALEQCSKLYAQLGLKQKSESADSTAARL